MKKTIVLMTIVLAILAAPVFAEVTASGSVEFDWAFAVDDNYEAGTDNTASIDLGGTVGDFTSISAVVEDGDLNDMTLTQDVTGALGVEGPLAFSYTVGVQSYEPTNYAGVAPKSLEVVDAKAGQGWEWDQTMAVAGEGGVVSWYAKNFKDNSLLGFKGMFVMNDMINVDVAVYPSSMLGYKQRSYYKGLKDMDALEFGANAYGTFGIVDASVYYVASAATTLLKKPDADTAWGQVDAVDSKGNRFGINLAAAPIENLTVGAAMEIALKGQEVYMAGYDDEGTWMETTVENEIQKTYISADAAYVMDALTAGVSLKTSFADDDVYWGGGALDINGDDEEVTAMQTTSFKVSGEYAVNDMLSVNGAFGMPFAAPKAIDEDGEWADAELNNYVSYEAGAALTLDAVTYGLGYTLSSDYMAYNGEFLNEDLDEKVANVYFTIKASF